MANFRKRLTERQSLSYRLTSQTSANWSRLVTLWQAVKIAKASVISVVFGFLLFYLVLQAQDLFLEVRGSIGRDALYWAAFYGAVAIGWALPVYLSAAWILSRCSPPAGVLSDPAFYDDIRRALPAVLASLCFAAVLAGQLVSLKNAPTAVQQTSLWTQDDLQACISAGVAPCGFQRYWTAKLLLPISRLIDFVSGGNLLALAYATLAGTALWILAGGVRYWPAARYWRTFANVIWLVVLALALPASLLAIWYIVQVVSLELLGPLNLAHLLVLPLVTAALGYGVWRVLNVISRRREMSAAISDDLLRMPFAALLALTAFTLMVLLVVHPVYTGTLVPRALMVPFLLGLFVPFFTWLTSWSTRLRAPLGLALIASIVGVSSQFSDTHDVRATEGFLLSRDSVDDSVGRWAAVNGCKIERTDTPGKFAAPGCPSPIILSAAGGASRAAFLVGGLVGTLMDETSAAIVEGHDKPIETVRFSPDGKKLLTTSEDADLKLWDGDSGAELATFKGHKNQISSAVFSRDGSRLLTSAGDSTARLWDVATGREVALLRVGSGQTNSAEFSPDGRLAIATFYEAVARIWDSQTGAVVGTLEGHRGTLASGSFSPDGSRIVTASQDGVALLWDAATRLTIGAPLQISEAGNNLFVNAGKVEFTADGKRFLTRASRDKNEARLWDAQSAKLIANIIGDDTVVLSPDGRRIISTNFSEEKLRLWDGVTGARIAEIGPRRPGFLDAYFSPDGRLLATPGDEATLNVWTLDDGKLLHALKPTGWSWPYRGAFSPDSKRLITAGSGGAAELWDASSGKRSAVLEVEDAKDVAFGAGGNRIATVTATAVQLWDGKSGAAITTFPVVASKRPSTKSRELRPFGKQLFALSGVSGGALSSVVAYTAIADSQMQDRAVNGIGKPPCRKDAIEGNWFAPFIKGASAANTETLPQIPWKPDESWRGCLELLLSGDFLSPVFVSLIADDLLQLGFRGDRAATLEQAWEKRYATIGPEPKDKPCVETGGAKEVLKGPTLANPIVSVRSCVLLENGKNWLPVLLLNGTSVSTGRRIIASDVKTIRANDLTGAPGQKIIRMFADAYDLHELMTGEETGMFEKGDIRLSTGATMSARFPVISPHGNIRNRKSGKIVDRVVDGGYFENYGAITALELANTLRNFGLKPFVIVVNNEPALPKLDCITDDSSLPHPNPKQTAAFSTLGSPLKALLATGAGRATLAAVELCDAIGRENFAFVTVLPDKDNPEKALSMSWWLSMHVQKYLDAQLSPDGINKGAFQKIRSVR